MSPDWPVSPHQDDDILTTGCFHSRDSAFEARYWGVEHTCRSLARPIWMFFRTFSSSLVPLLGAVRFFTALLAWLKCCQQGTGSVDALLLVLTPLRHDLADLLVQCIHCIPLVLILQGHEGAQLQLDSVQRQSRQGVELSAEGSRVLATASRSNILSPPFSCFAWAFESSSTVRAHHRQRVVIGVRDSAPCDSTLS